MMIFLSGCFESAPEIKHVYVTKTVEVQVPVYKCATVDIDTKRPELAISKLNSTSSVDEVFKAYPVSIYQCKDYSKYLETIIEKQNEPNRN